MQKYATTLSLRRFRRDALHRKAMCAALGEEDPRYLAVATSAGACLDRMDSRTAEVRQAEDALVQARAVERASKLRAAKHYDQMRRDLAAEAVRLVPTLLPTPPSALRKAGIGRVLEIVTVAAKNLDAEACPPQVREEHLPAVLAHLARLRAADTAEDEIRASFAALRAAVALFKADLESSRVGDYAELVKLTGTRAEADEFFLSVSGRAVDTEEDEEPQEPASGGGQPIA